VAFKFPLIKNGPIIPRSQKPA